MLRGQMSSYGVPGGEFSRNVRSLPSVLRAATSGSKHLPQLMRVLVEKLCDQPRLLTDTPAPGIARDDLLSLVGPWPGSIAPKASIP